jgi:hypothetical protein
MYDTTIKGDAPDIVAELARLGLKPDDITYVAQRWYVHATGFTPHHPPASVGIACWGEAVAALRDQLRPRGWEPADDRNCALVKSPDGKLAISVATGTAGTGRREGNPTNRHPKGIGALEAVAVNQRQLDLPFVDVPGRKPTPAYVTWFLLLYKDSDEIRCELSLPSDISGEWHITAWAHRIVLPPIPIDDTAVEIDVPEGDDIDIDVRRRQ